MSCPLARDLRVNTLMKQIGDVRMAEAVERNRSNAGLAHKIAELAAQLVWWPEAAVHIREDRRRLAEPQCHALFGLATPVHPQNLHSYARERHGTPALPGLRCLEPQAIPCLFQGLLHRDCAPAQIQVTVDRRASGSLGRARSAATHPLPGCTELGSGIEPASARRSTNGHDDGYSGGITHLFRPRGPIVASCYSIP